MRKIRDFLIENYRSLIVLSVIIGVISGIGYTAYQTRVVEYKDFPAKATITGTHFRAGYDEPVQSIDDDGNVEIHFRHHDPDYGFCYDVEYNGTVYKEYEEVGASVYWQHRTGDKLDATFRREWRADGSESYSIYVIRQPWR